MKRGRRRKKEREADGRLGSTVGLLACGSVFVGAVTFAFLPTDKPPTASLPQSQSPSLALEAAEMPQMPGGGPDGRTTLRDRRASSSKPRELHGDRHLARFTICHTGGGKNCVVDGDTLWVNGLKIRIADIDAPETHPPRCEREAILGERATTRLTELMNAGPFELRVLDRPTDRYGRALRIVVRDQQSIGDLLVAEGLARPWGGARQPWC